ncbi:MAG: hypothetical protein ACKVHU_12470 [Acidimicrobiales bacterium]|jgi:hypothetical protein
MDGNPAVGVTVGLFNVAGFADLDGPGLPIEEITGATGCYASASVVP